MKRRNFLKAALATSFYTGIGLSLLSRVAQANSFPVLGNKVLVNIMLEGGPDFRHVFPPAFNADQNSYGFQYWKARASSHAIGESVSAYQSRWDDDYFHVSDGIIEFGILKKCGWLLKMWEAGNVAIVHNTVGATTRNHAHCRLVMGQGRLDSGPQDAARSGWGGRLAAYAGGNVLSLIDIPTNFTYGPHPSDPEKHSNRNLISARDTRNFSLYRPGDEVYPNSPKRHISRSLQGYYQALKMEVDNDSIYAGIVDHERFLSALGASIDERLSMISVPGSITSLMDENGILSWPSFGKQIRNLYDSFTVSDILSMRVASLVYKGFDSHRTQREVIEPKFEDLFGDGKSLDVLTSELPDNVLDNAVYVIGGEFGRQLVANGDNGTDHGKGNAILLIGRGVKGGIYGDMFPENELAILADDGADITGLTTIDSLFSAVSDWVAPGSGAAIFPDRTFSTVEDGVDLGSLFI